MTPEEEIASLKAEVARLRKEIQALRAQLLAVGRPPPFA